MSYSDKRRLLRYTISENQKLTTLAAFSHRNYPDSNERSSPDTYRVHIQFNFRKLKKYVSRWSSSATVNDTVEVINGLTHKVHVDPNDMDIQSQHKRLSQVIIEALKLNALKCAVITDSAVNFVTQRFDKVRYDPHYHLFLTVDLVYEKFYIYNEEVAQHSHDDSV